MRVHGRLYEELLILVSGKEDRLADERLDLVVISCKLDVEFVVLLKQLRYLEGGTEGGEVGLLAFLG
jgi:hypothetical protein